MADDLRAQLVALADEMDDSIESEVWKYGRRLRALLEAGGPDN